MDDRPATPVTVCIALGSNLGRRAETLRNAIRSLEQLSATRVVRVSAMIETSPVGPAGQGDYLNAAAVLETTLPPKDLLTHLQRIETEHGRVRRERWGPRTLDLDLILYGDVCMDEPGLTVPHPRFRERLFVLEPMARIAPDAVDPTTGRTISELHHAASSCDAAI
ncbi:MAG: 2-amino-4-hydroxy-6-hydroxymethyldihydropteridine diphosphokinase [Phycisphaerales bacterium]|nr:2-amino-4-hydroxy-6-hydroxymethyldihydropteridine diphosphokinase [Phycisphaerales bacterium]